MMTSEQRAIISVELDKWFTAKGLLPAEIVAICASHIAAHVATDAKTPEHLERGKDMICLMMRERITDAARLREIRDAAKRGG